MVWLTEHRDHSFKMSSIYEVKFKCNPLPPFPRKFLIYLDFHLLELMFQDFPQKL